MELSQDQKQVHDAIIENKNPLVTIGGYAGTGKTFLISEIRKSLEKLNPKIYIAFVTFTGKAASVLKQKLGHINKYKHYIGTIHSLIYKPEFHYHEKLHKMIVTNWIKVEKIGYDIIIIDEASMISEELMKDLQSYKKPIIAVGDHGQLPPVADSPYNLMKNPDYKLEKIHRQSEGNPIIRLSEIARKYGSIKFGVYNNGIAKLPRRDNKTMDIFHNINWGEDVIVLCALNKTRVELNNSIRKKLNFDSNVPYPGERLICLNNNRESGIMNGQTGMLMLLSYETPEILEVCIQMDGVDNIYNGLIYYPVFGQEQYSEIFSCLKEKGKDFKKITRNTEFKHIDFFDFGYCISVHKSQGSEWKRVVLFEERSYFWDDEYYAKWLYTGLTRAQEKLLLISYD